MDFFPNRAIYFWNKLPDQKKSYNCIKNLRLNDFINDGKKKEFKREFFFKGWYEKLVKRGGIKTDNSVYVQSNNSFKRLIWEVS